MNGTNRLALSHNPSCLLPREIVQCDRLRYLNLRWNKLELFPAVVRIATASFHELALTNPGPGTTKARDSGHQQK